MTSAELLQILGAVFAQYFDLPAEWGTCGVLAAGILLGLHKLAVVAINVTGTPAAGTLAGQSYRVIELLAGVVSARAKDKGGPRGAGVEVDILANGFRKLAVPLLALGLIGGLSACTLAAKPETPAQTVYAVESDYQLAQRAALAYVSRPDADPAIERRVKELESGAYGAIAAARRAAIAGDDPKMPAAVAAAEHAVAALVTYLREKEISR